jgi:hypothetical protein
VCLSFTLHRPSSPTASAQIRTRTRRQRELSRSTKARAQLLTGLMLGVLPMAVASRLLELQFQPDGSAFCCAFIYTCGSKIMFETSISSGPTLRGVPRDSFSYLRWSRVVVALAVVQVLVSVLAKVQVYLELALLPVLGAKSCSVYDGGAWRDSWIYLQVGRLQAIRCARGARRTSPQVWRGMSEQSGVCFQVAYTHLIFCTCTFYPAV